MYPLSSFKTAKQLVVFLQSAQYISMIVFIACLQIKHRDIPLFVIASLDRYSIRKSGNSHSTIRTKKGSYLKHIPKVSVSFCCS